MSFSTSEKKVNILLRTFWQNLVQVIVQSKFGEKYCTCSSDASRNSNIYSLQVEEHEDILHEIRRCPDGQIPTLDKPISVEILLHTKEKDELLLEVWTLAMGEGSPQIDKSKIYDSPYLAATEHMALILKSVLSITRTTPAYSLSFNQNSDNYVMVYRLCSGTPHYENLGENYVHHKLGRIPAVSSYLTLTLAYRTQLTINKPPINVEPILVKSDHFNLDLSPKHETCMDSSDNLMVSDESQDAGQIFGTSPLDRRPFDIKSRTSKFEYVDVCKRHLKGDNDSTASNECQEEKSSTFKTVPLDRRPFPSRSRTCSENSAKHLEPDIFTPFVNECRTTSEEDFMSDDVPFSNLLRSYTAERAEEIEENRAKTKNNTITKEASGVPGKSDVAVSDNSSILSSKTLTEETGFQLFQRKTAFAAEDGCNTKVPTFYLECNFAPQLNFENPENSINLENLSEHLKSFEASMEGFEALEKSFDPDNTDVS